ncbi:MAG: methylenetetrahydrofolate reductase, partial [Chloroflexi bacterium]|nr:methylenetetrahydrofolate reductase [Chloroflexota bacterium]
LKPGPIIAGIILLKSGRQAAGMNRIPGIRVPQALMDEIETAQDKRAASVEIAARIIKAVRPLCRGVHIMAQGWEQEIPKVLEAAGLA